LAGVTIADALRHPTWSMGAKITIDSATLMNKGLEVIEARHLFALADDEVEVIVHPQSLIHAMVRLEDGSVLTHCGPPDMRVPIGYALRHPAPPPQRPVIDLIGRELTFFSPDADTFKCLALDTGGTAPAVLNGANEVAVAAFLDGRIGFMDIPALVAHALDTVPVEPADTLDGVMAADHAARTAVSAAMAVRV
jgi:1-deoxy-D-xylulose-5-phosphate reductoisomerase